MTNHSHKIGFIGGGKMATAFIGGLLSKNICPSQHIMAHTKTGASQEKLHQTFKILAAHDNCNLVNDCDTIVLAIKPQELQTVLAEIAPHVTEKHLIISLVTGATVERIQKALGKLVPVALIATNTPARIGLAAQGVVFSNGCSNAERQWVLRLANAVGTTVEISAEQFNSVLAVAGSGPAFIFWLMECFIKAGKEIGLPENISTQLTLQTFVGASQLAATTPDSLANLIAQVTSPGGMTLEGLKKLNSSDCQNTIVETIAAALKRARELGNA